MPNTRVSPTVATHLAPAARPIRVHATADVALRRNLAQRLLAGTLVAAAIGTLGIAGGCASHPTRRIDRTTESMAATRASINAGAAQVDDVVNHLNSLGATASLEASYLDYCDAVAVLEKDARRVRERWATLTTRANEYESAWEREIASISGNEARAITEARRETFRNRIADLRDSMEALKNAYDPFLTELTDLKSVLANDLTQGGVRAIHPLREQANVLARRLREQLAETRRVIASAEAEYTTDVRAASAGEFED